MIKSNLLLRKTSVQLAVVALLVMMVAPNLVSNVNASFIIDSNSATVTGQSDIKAIYPDGGAVVQAVSQSVNGTGYILNSIILQMNRVGDPTGTIHVSVCLGNGTIAVGDVNYPTGDELISSSTVSIASLSENPTYSSVQFTFTGLLMTFNQTYCFFVCADAGATFDGTHYIRVGTGGSHVGTPGKFLSAAWIAGPGDTVFVMYGATSSDGTTVPIGVTDADTLVNAFASFIVPIVFLLLPVLLLILVTRSTDKWIILIGLTIGAGLGYYFGMVPIWIVFLISIGLIGMAYQSVKGGG